MDLAELDGQVAEVGDGVGDGLEEDEDAIDLVDRIPDMPIRDGHAVADFVVCAYFTSDYSPAHPCPPLPS